MYLFIYLISFDWIYEPRILIRQSLLPSIYFSQLKFSVENSFRKEYCNRTSENFISDLGRSCKTPFHFLWNLRINGKFWSREICIWCKIPCSTKKVQYIFVIQLIFFEIIVKNSTERDSGLQEMADGASIRSARTIEVLIRTYLSKKISSLKMFPSLIKNDILQSLEVNVK